MNTSGLWIVLLLLFLASAAHASPQTDRKIQGQWIWSGRDKEVFLESRKRHPDLVPAVWIGTVALGHGEIVLKLALSPVLKNEMRPAVVVRFDDSIHAVWDEREDEAIASLVGEKLLKLLEHVRSAGAIASEIQLDYDCPVRLLPRWAAVLKILDEGVLKGNEVWITSLVAHLKQPRYGDLFRDKVAGHILQVFDTGEDWSSGGNSGGSSEDAGDISSMLAGQKMPFRMGLGAFERHLPGDGTTTHRLWFGFLPAVSKNPWYRGVLVFPAGQKWVYLMGGL